MRANQSLMLSQVSVSQEIRRDLESARILPLAAVFWVSPREAGKKKAGFAAGSLAAELPVILGDDSVVFVLHAKQFLILDHFTLPHGDHPGNDGLALVLLLERAPGVEDQV